MLLMADVGMGFLHAVDKPHILRGKFHVFQDQIPHDIAFEPVLQRKAENRSVIPDHIDVAAR